MNNLSAHKRASGRKTDREYYYRGDRGLRTLRSIRAVRTNYFLSLISQLFLSISHYHPRLDLIQHLFQRTGKIEGIFETNSNGRQDSFVIPSVVLRRAKLIRLINP